MNPISFSKPVDALSRQGIDQPGRRLAGLDHLRALAILLVFIFHYRQYGNPGWFETPGSFGWIGVDLFFALSGYLIGGQLLSRLARGASISYGEFYFKRFLRIIPAYLFVLFLYFAFPAFRERSVPAPLWKFLTFTQNLGLDAFTQGAFSNAWSLCIEEQFYLLLPLILIVLWSVNAGRHAYWLLIALFFMGLGLRYYSWMHFIQPVLDTPGGELGSGYHTWIYYPTYNRLDGLLAGIGIAALVHFKPGIWDRISRYGNAWLILSLAILTGAWFLNRDVETLKATLFGFPLVDLGCGVLVLAAISPTCLLYRYGSGVSRWLATLSYSIYLTHKPLIHGLHVILRGYGLNDDSNTMFWASALVCILGGFLLYRVVERPFLGLRDRLLAKRADPNNQASPAGTIPVKEA